MDENIYFHKFMKNKINILVIKTLVKSELIKDTSKIKR